MAGVNHNQIAHNSMLHTKAVELANLPVADDNYLVDDADVSAVAAGDAIALTNDRVPGYGSNITATLTNAGASTADLDIYVRGRNQFGELVEELLEGLTKAGGAVTGSKVFSHDISVEVESVDGAVGSGDILDIGFGSVRGLPVKLSRADYGQVKNITRLPTTKVDIDSDTIDVDESALKGDGANGAGSNSGVFANGDSYSILIEIDPSKDSDRLIK